MNKIIGQRLEALRENTKVSQTKLAKAHGKSVQSAVNRYENSQSEVPSDILLWHADYFDESLEHIYGRCDSPQGKLYDLSRRFGKRTSKCRRLSRCALIHPPLQTQD